MGQDQGFLRQAALHGDELGDRASRQERGLPLLPRSQTDPGFKLTFAHRRGLTKNGYGAPVGPGSRSQQREGRPYPDIAPLPHRRCHLQDPHPNRCGHGSRAARRRDAIARARLASGLEGLWLRILHLAKLEPGHREVRGGARHLRHASHLLHRHAYRRPGQSRHRRLPHRDLPRALAPDDRHCH